MTLIEKFTDRRRKLLGLSWGQEIFGVFPSHQIRQPEPGMGAREFIIDVDTHGHGISAQVMAERLRSQGKYRSVDVVMKAFSKSGEPMGKSYATIVYERNTRLRTLVDRLKETFQRHIN